MSASSEGENEFAWERGQSELFRQFDDEWESTKSRQLLREIAKAGKHREEVLILGQTGCGKSRIAKCIHQLRKYDGPFKQLNMAAISPSLIHSELFGYVKGAFTGCRPEGKMGLIEAGDQGTLFLDEIGDADMGTQKALLTFLDSADKQGFRTILPVGETEPKKVDVRIIAATNKDLDEEIAAKCFRMDLFYRLTRVVLRVPPLAERREDIPKIAHSLVEGLAKRYKGHEHLKATKIDKKAVARLTAFGENWTGNIRQLESILVSAFMTAGANPVITKDHLPDEETWSLSTRATDRRPSEWEMEEWLGNLSRDDMMRVYVRGVYRRAGKVKKTAAHRAGVRPETMADWVKEYYETPDSSDPVESGAGQGDDNTAQQQKTDDGNRAGG